MAPGDIFSALANPVRRQLLDALREGPRAVNDLAGLFELSRPAVSEHLQVLRLADLVEEEPRGRERYYHLRAARLAEVDDWLHPFERYWRDRMRTLADVLDADELDADELEADELEADELEADELEADELEADDTDLPE